MNCSAWRDRHYAWGRGFDNPGKNTIRTLLDEFYAAAYGRKSSHAEIFYRALRPS
ncbi:MAG: hypothetical protein V8T87_08080 [Victivallales bacterium]